MWKEINFVPHKFTSSAIIKANENWIINSYKQVYAVSTTSNEMIWEQERGNYSTAYRAGVCIDNIAVFENYPNNNYDIITLRGYDGSTGTIIWEFKKERNKMSCGLHTNGSWLIYSDSLSGTTEQFVFFADPKTGETIHHFPTGEASISSGRLRHTGKTLTAVAGDYIYFCDPYENKLYFAKLDLATTELSLSETISNVLMLDAFGEIVYIAIWTGNGEERRDFIVAINSNTQEELTRIEYQNGSKLMNLIALSNDLALLTFVKGSKGQGITLINIGTGKVSWQLGVEEQWYVSHAVVTPTGILATVYKSIDRRFWLARLNPETGEQLPAPTIKKEVESIVQWDGETLVVDTLHGLRMFEWDEAYVEPEVVIESKPDVGESVDAAAPIRTGADALVTLDASTPATSADLQLQSVVNAFLDSMKNKSKPDIFAAKTREFQSLAATMFDAYPETSDVTIVAALVQLGVPQSVASNDVLIMLYKELPEEE